MDYLHGRAPGLYSLTSSNRFLLKGSLSSYAELGSMIPLSGGAQAYLNYAYGPLLSYLFSWTSITVVKPGGGAIIALIFG